MPRLTVAQALVRLMSAQHVERDGERAPLFAGCLGIFGHGNVAGLGEALLAAGARMPYYLARNEQAMVHTAAAFARERCRLATLACTTSVGPGATNLVTGAAAATINRLPVLLLPGDVFATRGPHPVLQQLEHPSAGDVTVNDCLRPVSRYFDRVQRPEQLADAALAAMRVLTDPAETGAVTLCLPQDVQAEAHDFPEELFAPRTWTIRRRPPEASALADAVAMIRAARRPLIVAGGGVIYSGAADALGELVAATGIPVAETQAGKGSLPWQQPCSLGGVGATGTLPANRIAASADLVIGVGTRWSDFTTASKTAFAAHARFVNVNLVAVDLAKHSALALEADARAALQALAVALEGFRVEDAYREEIARLRAAWDGEVQRLYAQRNAPLPAQAEIVGAVEAAARPDDVIVAAAGSLPGDLHKLWRARRPGSYHVEYGYSTMGYEIAGALGVKLASPQREVFALLGDGSYLMLSSELATAVQEDVKLIVVLIDNRGFASIGALSRSVGTDGFGTRYRRRRAGSLSLDGDPDDDAAIALPIDLAANAESLGAEVIRVEGIDELAAALQRARSADGLVVVSVAADRLLETPSYESWWDVPVAEVSERADVRAARERYEAERARRHEHLRPSRPDDE